MIMTVKELIELLESCDGDSVVFMHVKDDVFKQTKYAFEAQTDEGQTITVID